MEQIFSNILYKTPITDWIGFTFSVLQVLFAYKNNIVNYLFGIIGSLLTVYVYFNGKLYAEMSVNVYYFIMSIYGWYIWHRPKTNNSILPISYTSLKEKLITAGIILFSYLIISFILINYTDSEVPHLDAVVSSFAWAGMWLLAKRKIENWIILNISNLIAIFLLWHKGIHLYSILSLILFIVAVAGYSNWKKIYLFENQKRHE